MLPWTAIPMIAGPLAGALSDRIGGGPVVAVGLALQAMGLRLWALPVEPQVHYPHVVPAQIHCGIGMGMFFAPTINLVMSTVRPQEESVTFGANNAIREVGGAIGVPSLAAIFSAQGDYESASTFAAGLTRALCFAAGTLGVAGALVFLMPSLRETGGPAADLPPGDTPAPAPAAI